MTRRIASLVADGARATVRSLALGALLALPVSAALAATLIPAVGLGSVVAVGAATAGVGAVQLGLGYAAAGWLERGGAERAR